MKRLFEGVEMKRLLSLVMLLAMLASCSAIENATEKWKTPETPNAGLSEGEKSNYLGREAVQDDRGKIPTKPAAKKTTKKTAKPKTTK